MSDEDPTQTGELGPMPDPVIEPPEPNPGGADALPEEADNIVADLDPAKNPAVDESPDPLKESLAEGEDTETEATKESAQSAGDDAGPGGVDGGGDAAAEEESPA